MKRKLNTLGLIAGIAVILALVAFAVYRSEWGQDRMLQTAVNAIMQRSATPSDSLRVIVCGSASPLGNNIERAQACIAVQTPEHVLLFDVGARSPMRVAQAGLPLDQLVGIFLTHFHSDHITGLPDVNLASWVQGRADRMQVFGPAGVEQVVTGFNQALELDFGYRTAHHGEALLPSELGPMQANPFTPGGTVWEDESLRVSSFLVDHPPIEPAVGYRIDYRGRSVVISGDTNVTTSLFDAASGADLLLHDALSPALLETLIAAARNGNRSTVAQIMTDVKDYHAEAEGIVAAAAAAGISQLVFYHLVPVPLVGFMEEMFLRGLPEEVILARDLQVFELPVGSAEVSIHEP